MITPRRLFSWKLAVFSVAVNLCILLCAAGSLTWSSTDQQFKARTGDEKIVAVYPFKNTGNVPVRIISVTSTCTCTTGRPDKEVYAPGEAGELKVEFDIGPQVGRQDRPITVVTDDPPSEPTVLKIVVEIAEPISLQPKLLFWKVGEEDKEKAVAVSLDEPATAKLVGLRPGRADFSSRLEKSENSGKYFVWIKPASTAKPSQAIIYLEAAIDGAPRSFAIFAAVK